MQVQMMEKCKHCGEAIHQTLYRTEGRYAKKVIFLEKPIWVHSTGSESVHAKQPFYHKAEPAGESTDKPL
jgi:hypothetical protein